MEEPSVKVKIGVYKCGNVGTAPIFELLLDELAQRKDITVRTITTGAKMSLKDVKDVFPQILEFAPDLLVIISPNPAVSGPAAAREMAIQKGVNTVVMSDAVAKQMVKDLNMNTDVRVMPIVREKDNLAMSSRNTYLSPDERLQALGLYQSLLQK